jgi:hypothetical protein
MLIAVLTAVLLATLSCDDPTDPNTAPVAALSHAPTVPTTGETVEFDASDSEDPDGEITEYRWTFKEGGEEEITNSPSTQQTYTISDTFQATVTAVDDAGSEDSASVTVEVVGNSFPQVALSYDPQDPSTGENMTFDATESEDPDGTIIQFRWDFDNDGTAEQTSPTGTIVKSFGSPGEHKVSVVAEDEDGATGQDTVTLVVQ